jgi:hypothetical protein
MHHIAIGTPDIVRMGDFYSGLPGLNFVKNNYFESGDLRSVWLCSGSVIIMIEKDPVIRSPKALVFSVKESGLTKDQIKEIPLNWTHSTEYTIYFTDPDGNILGYTDFPAEFCNI